MKLSRTILTLLATVGCSSSPSATTDDAGIIPQQDQEAGPAATTGYLLFNPTSSKTTYLTDTSGHIVHTWTATRPPGLGIRLLANGDLLRAEQSDSSKSFGTGGGSGGQITLYDWDGALKWTVPYATSEHLQHHDVEMLPNGHVLFTAWEKETGADAIAKGRNPSTIPASNEIWSDSVMELDPTTPAIVWEWHAWDHLLQPGQVASEHPELLDLNKGGMASEDWLHLNSLRYSPTLDRILVSSHNMSEIWIIDHKSGNLMYRWGNPSSYGASGDRQLYGQHCARFIEPGLPGAGNITIFDNGQNRKPSYSRALEITPPDSNGDAYTRSAGTAFGPGTPTWSWQGPGDGTSFYADMFSSVQRVASGNTVITNGPAGTFFEVDPSGAVQWSFQLTAAKSGSVSTYQIERIESNDPRLEGRTLVAGEVVTL